MNKKQVDEIGELPTRILWDKLEELVFKDWGKWKIKKLVKKNKEKQKLKMPRGG